MPNSAAPRFADRPEDLPAPGDFAALSGIEVMQAVLTGRLPAPPICRTMRCRLAEIGEATHVGRRTGVAEGRLVDAQGSTTCPIFDL